MRLASPTSTLRSRTHGCPNCSSAVAPGSAHCPTCGLDPGAAMARALTRTADLCPQCSRPMRWERSHYVCDGPACRSVFLTCCEGAPAR